MIEKYPHHGPEWSFSFKHPLDGRGQIEVEKTEDDFVLIRKSWSIDDYDTSTRFLKYLPGQKSVLDHSDLHQALEKALKDILEWKEEDLAPFKVPHPWSKHCSREEFYKQYERLPTLRRE